MGKPIINIKYFKNTSLNTDDAPEHLAPTELIDAINMRFAGTAEGEDGYGTNIESNVNLTTVLPSGISTTVGVAKSETLRKAFAIKYNTEGFHQVAMLEYDTDTETIIYTDKANSGGQQLLNLNPQSFMQMRIINDTYLVFADGNTGTGYINLTTLINGGYGTLIAEDFSLIKPQCLIPVTGVYASDAGKASNFVKNKLLQFTVQYVNADFNYSTWATWSKRIIPSQESTPTEGTNVSENNCIIVSLNIGSIRAAQLNIACRYGLFDYNTIKTIDRSYILALPNTAVNIGNQVFEAYDPVTNLYSFVFYNESLNIPVPATETDQFVDYIWVANAIEIINGNIIALGDLKVGYDRPTTAVTLAVTGYNPNLTIDTTTEPNPLKVTVLYAGGEGSGSNKPKRRMQVTYTGVPHTGDILSITTNSASNAADITNYSYTVPGGQDGNLAAVALSFSGILSGAVTTSGGSYIITFYEDPRPHRRIQIATVTLFNAGATISKSIHALLDNSSYQLALSYRDSYGRPFPLLTNSTFIVNTPSFAQLQGNTPRINWTVPSAAPVGAYDYQWLITKNTTASNILDVMGNLLSYKGTWNSRDNVPTLAASIGTVGDTYQITTPNFQTTNHVNLGNGEENFKTGDYVSYNGKSWDIIEKSFADLTDTGNVLAIKINPLNLFNQRYTNNGIDTVLSYDFVQGDKCTFHYYINTGTPGLKFYINNPCVDVEVFGYDPATYLVKVQKSSSVDPSTLIGKDLFIRLWSPNTQQAETSATTDNTTVWFEIGERFTITNGVHDAITGLITDGDVYFKTRSYNGGVDPATVYNILATDFNFSDFYVSNFTSYGRPRQFYDILEKTEQKASIIYSQNYILGSRNNGLNRFFKENLYGDGDGQTSSNYGAIQVLWQRNEYLVVIQELKVGYIPVFISIIEDNIQQQQVGISEKLLNNIRYNSSGNHGIGRAKESFDYYGNNAWFVDPNRSEPIRVGLDGVLSISGKMSQFFKKTLQNAYAKGTKIIGYYDVYNSEYILSIGNVATSLIKITFDNASWDIFEPYTIVAGDITAVTPGPHATVVNNGDGTATFTPTTNYVGNNVGTMTFNTEGGPITKNICLNWTQGEDVIDSFSFTPVTGQPLSTTVNSNSVLISGNTVPVSVSIVGGQYSVNGGAFTSSPGFVNAGDSVVVNVVTSGSESTPASSTLTVSSYSATFTATTGTVSVAPFTFTDVTNANLSQGYISNSILVSGNTLPAPIGVLGGYYSINGGAFVATSGTVNAGDTVRVEGTSSASDSTPVDVLLSIDGQSDTFTITTGVTTIAPFGFTTQTEVQPSTLYTSNTISPTGNSIGVPISISAGQYSINGGTFINTPSTFNPGDNVTVRQVSSSLVPTTTATINLTIGGTVGTFSVTTYHVCTVNLHVTEPSSPYADGNLQVKNNGIIVNTLNGDGSTGPITIQSRLLITAEAFSELPATGPSPTKTLDVKIGGVSVVGYPQTNSDNPGDPSIVWGDTGIDNATYDFYVTAAISGGTLPADATGILQVDLFNIPTLEICGYVSTPGLTPTNQAVYKNGHEFYPNSSTPPEACYALASDLQPSGILKYRFQFNIAALLTQYPSAPSFTFVIRGRNTVATMVDTSYSKKGADAGKMVMTGGPGTYLPGTSGATDIGTIGVYGLSVAGGADGTIGVGVGSIIIQYVYNVAAKTVTPIY